MGGKKTKQRKSIHFSHCSGIFTLEEVATLYFLHSPKFIYSVTDIVSVIVIISTRLEKVSPG